MEHFIIDSLDLHQDVEAIVNLHRADLGNKLPASDEPDTWYRLGGPWMTPLLALPYFEDLVKCGCQVIVARYNGDIVAEAEVEPIDANQVFLSVLMVHPSYRNRGIGHQIVRHIQERLRQAKIKQIVTCPEVQAYSFYRDVGFTPWRRRVMISGDCQLCNSPNNIWRTSNAPPKSFPMVLGYNQPPSHHHLILSMKYFSFLGRGSSPASYISVGRDRDEVIVGFIDNKTESSRRTWVLGWGQKGVTETLSIALEFISTRTERRWFSYCAEKEVQLLGYTPQSTEEWWVSNIA